jgi:transglutaminase-like putative cysteine protease
MKTPPFLLGATLLFWGWQTGLVIPGVIMGVVLEGSRFVKIRWDLSDEDFNRIWTFCALLFLAAAVYAFADNGGPEGFARIFHGMNLSSEQEVGSVSARTAAAFIRWLPMVFILFVAAQAFSGRQEIPLYTISLILRWRWKQAKKHGQPLPPMVGADVTYPYFAVCLFASSVHPNKNDTFFWGLCALLAWALWMNRPRRFAVIIWVIALAGAVAFGYSGARGIGLVQRYVDNLNVQWLADLLGRNRTDAARNRTAIGQIGRIKTSMRIVIRLQPETGDAPAYLREASYRLYRSSVWFAPRFRNNSTPDYFTTTNQGTWLLGIADKTNASRIGIECYLTGRSRDTHNPQAPLPLPSGTTRLENLSALYSLQQNKMGTVLAEGPGLIQFDAIYGPGETIDGPPETNPVVLLDDTNFEQFPLRDWETNGALDLRVPTNEAPVLEQIASNLHLKGQSYGQTLRTISAFFATKFSYRTWQEGDVGTGTNQTPLGRFLVETHAGHCEYFATATVLLLREVGIPARYAVGYSVHEVGWSGYVVRQRDAHAWCLVWNDRKRQWEDFDTTPGSWLEAESEHGAITVWFADVCSWVQFEFSKLRWGQTHLRDYILIGLIPVLTLLLWQIVRQRRQRAKDAGTVRAVVWPGLDSEFYEIEKELAQRGVPREQNEALTEWLRRAAHESSFAELQGPLQALLRLHYRYRFDPRGLDDDDRKELRRQARACLDELARLEKAAVS